MICARPGPGEGPRRGGADRGGTYPGAQDGQAGLAVRLHRRLHGVDRCEDHAERRGGERREDGLRERGEVPEVLVRLEEREDADVRRGVAEARHGALHERGEQALVVARPAAVRVERARRLRHRRAVAVLVVHDRPEGHERQDLQDHRRGATEAAAEGFLQCSTKVKLLQSQR